MGSLSGIMSRVWVRNGGPSRCMIGSRVRDFPNGLKWHLRNDFI